MVSNLMMVRGLIFLETGNRKWLTPSSGNAYETNERVPRSTIDDLYKDWVSKIIIITVVFHALNQDLLHWNITVPVIVTPPLLYKVSILELWLTLGPLIRGLDWGLQPIFDATINGHTLWRKKSYCKSGHPFQIYLLHVTLHTI